MKDSAYGYSPGPFVAVRVHATGGGHYAIDAIDADGDYSEVCWDSDYLASDSEWVPLTKERALAYVPEFAAEHAPGVTAVEVIDEVK